MLKSNHTSALALLVAASLTAAGNAQCTNAQLSDPGSQNFDAFGDSVAISGDWAVIGESSDDAPGALDCGSVFFYTRTGTVWSSMGAVFAGDRAAGDRFGVSVDIDGDYAVVGSPSDDYSGFNDLGSVYVYKRAGNTWNMVLNIVHPPANRANSNRFGSHVSISGNTIAVGAPFEGAKGAAYVFTRTGEVWNLQQRLSPATANNGSFFGCDVSVSGDTLAVGAESDGFAGNNSSGAAWVFVRNSGVWSANAKLLGNDTVTGDFFGRYLALDGNHLLVAAPFNGTGKSYAFVGIGGGVWNQTSTFDGGDAVAIDGQRFIIADTFAGNETVIGYRADPIGNTFVYTQTSSVTNPAGFPNVAFGRSIDVSGTMVIAGAPSADIAGQANNGAAYVFEAFIANDTCTEATPVSLGTARGCTVNAQRNGQATCDSTSFAPDVYHTFTAPCGGTYTFDTIGSTFDTILSLHSECGATAANTLACNDDTSGLLASRVNLSVSAGETVIVRVSGFQNAQGSYNLSITPSAPANDECTGATPVTEGEFSIDTCYATTSAVSTNLALVDDVWFAYEAGCSGNVAITTCGSEFFFDTILEVHQSSPCDALGLDSLIVTNDDAACGGSASRSSTLTFPAQAGGTYLIRAGGYGGAVAPFYSKGHATMSIALTAGCPADYNLDGGVDGSDVSVFFEDWSAAARPADVNCDGGIDGEDVSVFFAAWVQGGC